VKRLTAAALDELRSRGVRTPGYALSDVEVGVMHFGPGAFHRVHQASYFDELLSRDHRWGICEVSLQSSTLRDALEPQDGLYSLAVLDREPSLRIIGSTRQFLVARESSKEVLRQLVSPTLKLITATVTEKGYCLTPDGRLDFAHPQVQHDLQNPAAPLSLIGYLAEGLRQRRAAGLRAPLIVCCDNLTDNGHRLRRALLDFAERTDRDFAAWIMNETEFPRTMVDSITPATDEAQRSRVAEQIGHEDAWPVQREAFTQWVIEEHKRESIPDWESVGITVTNDVSGYERAKLRLLNGAHSSLAYLGSLAGIGTVAEAMSQPTLSTFIRSLMLEDIAPVVTAPSCLNVPAYIDSLLRRFENPTLPHRLSQIAWDGSQKIPIRLLGTLSNALATGKSVERLCLPIAAWLHFIRRKAHAGRLIDPLAKELLAVGARCRGDARHDVNLFLFLEQVFPAALAAQVRFFNGLVGAYSSLEHVNSVRDLAIALE